jgi:hypothetical protein
MAAFGHDLSTWGKFFFLASILHLAGTLYLNEILGRAFDHYWKPRLYHAGRRVRDQYVATFYYAGALLFPPVRRTVFGDNGFDFRGRVSRTTVFLCLLHCLLFTAMLATGLVFLSVVAQEGMAAWDRIPRPAPLPLPDPPE